jgi:hypothetical protein
MAVQSQSGGQLASALSRVRKWVDDPVVRSKYSDALILDLMNETWCEVLTDLFNQATNVPIARFDITLVKDQADYTLPANTGEILRIAKLDSDTGIPNWEVVPGSFLNPYGWGFRFEGSQRVILNPTPTASDDVLTVEYIPAGDIMLHVGKAPIANMTSSALQLATTGPNVLTGTVDRRPNAYLGCYVSVFDSDNGAPPDGYRVFPVQERIITAVDVADQTVTVSPDFDFDASAQSAFQNVKYEVYPVEAPIVWPIVTLYVAAKIVAIQAEEISAARKPVRAGQAGDRPQVGKCTKPNRAAYGN